MLATITKPGAQDAPSSTTSSRRSSHLELSQEQSVPNTGVGEKRRFACLCKPRCQLRAATFHNCETLPFNPVALWSPQRATNNPRRTIRRSVYFEGTEEGVTTPNDKVVR